MSKRAEQYEQNERAKAKARITSPITKDNHAHNMGENRASSNNTSDSSLDARSAVLATITRMQEEQRNQLAYLEVLEALDAQWTLMQVKRRFDRSH